MRNRKSQNEPFKIKEVRVLTEGLKQLENNPHTGNSKNKAYKKYNALLDHISEYGNIDTVLLRNAKASVVSSAKCGSYIGNEPRFLEGVRNLINKI